MTPIDLIQILMLVIGICLFLIGMFRSKSSFIAAGLGLAVGVVVGRIAVGMG